MVQEKGGTGKVMIKGSKVLEAEKKDEAKRRGNREVDEEWMIMHNRVSDFWPHRISDSTYNMAVRHNCYDRTQ